MAEPTPAEAAAYAGTVVDDPRVAACLGEAVEAIKQQLGTTVYTDTTQPTLHRVTLEVCKGLLQRRDDQVDAGDRRFPRRAAHVDPLATVWPTLRRLANQTPGVQ